MESAICFSVALSACSARASIHLSAFTARVFPGLPIPLGLLQHRDNASSVIPCFQTFPALSQQTAQLVFSSMSALIPSPSQCWWLSCSAP